MILDGAQLVLDTNILVHLLRGKRAGQVIERWYQVSQRSPRAIISVVTKGELKALAYKLDWGIDKRATLGAMLAGLPAADISHRAVYDAYADLDFRSMSIGIKMGKNDLWIAATTVVAAGVLLTTDGDFDHLIPMGSRSSGSSKNSSGDRSARPGVRRGDDPRCSCGSASSLGINR